MPNPILNNKIEGLCLGPNFTDERLGAFLDKCLRRETFITCVVPNPHQIEQASLQLAGSRTKVAGAVAFPLGNLAEPVKRVGIEAALKAGATRIDLVMRHESLNADDFQAAENEARVLHAEVRAAGAEFALIANLAMLTPEAKLAAARIAVGLDAALVTASGMGVETSLEDLHLLKEAFGEELHLTACGEIRHAESAFDLLGAGADRVRTFTPFEVLDGFQTLERHRAKDR